MLSSNHFKYARMYFFKHKCMCVCVVMHAIAAHQQQTPITKGKRKDITHTHTYSPHCQDMRAVVASLCGLSAKIFGLSSCCAGEVGVVRVCVCVCATGCAWLLSARIKNEINAIKTKQQDK